MLVARPSSCIGPSWTHSHPQKALVFREVQSGITVSKDLVCKTLGVFHDDADFGMHFRRSARAKEFRRRRRRHVLWRHVLLSSGIDEVEHNAQDWNPRS